MSVMTKNINWKKINVDEDIKYLMNIFGHFHDSCIKEMHFIMGSFVEADLSMFIGEEGFKVRILFQRQCQDPSAIELLFEGILKLNVTDNPGSNPIILGSTLLFDNGVYYWADAADWSSEDNDKNCVNWICAKTIQYRDVSQWIGPKLRYGPLDNN